MVGLVIAAILGISVANVGWDDLNQNQRHDATVILIEHYASQYGLSDAKKLEMLYTIRCETAGTYRTGIKSGHPGENSWGLAQINLPSHPHVSRETATDPDFAINFMAEKFSRGEARIWTCWRLL